MSKESVAYRKTNKDKYVVIKGEFPLQFVNDFRSACKQLDITQTSVIYNACKETIEKAKKSA